MHFMYLLRCAEHYGKSNDTLSRALSRYYAFRARRFGQRLGLTVPTGTCGPGLFIVHWGSLVVSGKARIGRNCRMHSGVNIGATDDGAPIIGDNVYIGPGAKIFGDITIGDNVKVGANSVVNQSFPSNVVIAGVPAKIVKSSEDQSEGPLEYASE